MQSGEAWQHNSVADVVTVCMSICALCCVHAWSMAECPLFVNFSSLSLPISS